MRQLKKICSSMVLGFALFGTSAGHAETLRVAADVGFAPFFMKQASGEIEGYGYDVINAVAKQAGYDGVQVIDTPFSSVFAGLFSKRFDVIAAPIAIAENRAEQILFTEPYIPTGLSMLVKNNAKADDLNDLAGKKIAVNSGSTSEMWVQEHTAAYNFEMQRFNKLNDAVQSMLIGRSYAVMSDTPAIRYIAQSQKNTKAVLHQDSGRNFAYSVRHEEPELRNRIESALECLKSTGKLQKIHEKWFGELTENDKKVVNEVWPGYGAPGFKGYQDLAHDVVCD